MIVAVAGMAFGAFVAALDTRQFHLDNGFWNRYGILVLHSKRLRRSMLHDQYSIQKKKKRSGLLPSFQVHARKGLRGQN